MFPREYLTGLVDVRAAEGPADVAWARETLGAKGGWTHMAGEKWCREGKDRGCTSALVHPHGVYVFSDAADLSRGWHTKHEVARFYRVTLSGKADDSPLGTVRGRSVMAQLPEPDPLIEDVVSLRSVVVMIGETGVGKTFASLGMLGSVTTGRPWLDHKVFQAMPAMHVLGEGAYGWHKRMTAWEAEYNDAAMIPDHMLQVIRQPASLLRQSTWDALTELAQRDGVRFIVFDTLSSLASDADETKDAPVIMRRLTDLANAIDGTVMLLHHPGWTNTGRSRGGSQLEANADEVLVLQKLGGQGTIDDGFTMTRKKVKEGEAGEKYYLRLARRHGSLVVVEDDHKRKHVSETSLILSFLEEHKLLTATGDRRKIAAKAKELGLTPGINKIENALKSWREGGLLDAL